MKLTAAFAKSVTRPGRYNDGGNLYLLVKPNGQKQWVFRFKGRDMGLGAYAEIPLAKARVAASAARELRRAGVDPIEARKAERAAKAREAIEAVDHSFKVVAEKYISTHQGTWKNEKHAKQWPSSLEAYVYPQIGRVHVREVDRAGVLSALVPIWAKLPETASRVRGRIEVVLDFAAAKGWRTAPNPARWRDLRHELPAPRKVKPPVNQPALPWRRTAEFMAELRTRPATAARALELAIFTAARTSEVLEATWREFDLPSATWVVPAARMKGARAHRVALSKQAVTVMETMKPLAAGAGSYVFPGARAKRPLSNMALLMLLRRMQGEDDEAEEGRPVRWADEEGRAITAHGFRATFSTWAADQTSFAPELVELALAHITKDKVRLAYQRGDLLERRRPLMQAWSDFVCGASAGRVVELAGARAG